MPISVLQSAKEFKDARAGENIQRGRRFIEQNKVRMAREG